MPFTISIVGRPNVGKSTLFNRLAVNRKALVDNQPGVTRDVRKSNASLADLNFTIIDTAGVELKPNSDLDSEIKSMTENAIVSSDACLFLVDARAGVVPSDLMIASILRNTGKPVKIVANKCDTLVIETYIYDFFSLGYGSPIAISAEHNLGMSELYELLRDMMKEFMECNAQDKSQTTSEKNEFIKSEISQYHSSKSIRIAILGRPNCGKSSLLNSILGEKRLITGDKPGTTRDAISFSMNWLGQDMEIFDTAGIRKKAKITDKIEIMSIKDGFRAARFAEVVIVLLDSQNPLESQDLRIIQLAESEGRAIVVSVNKWDLVKDKQKRFAKLNEQYENLVPSMRGTELVPVSALTGYGIQNLQKHILQSHKNWNQRISTANLNQWLSRMLNAHPPPLAHKQRIRLRFITQVNARPPTFVVKCSRPKHLPESYVRYLVNGLREAYGLTGTPIRVYLRSQSAENPFVRQK